MFQRLRLKKRNSNNTQHFTIKGEFYCKIVDVLDINLYAVIMKPFKGEDYSIFTVRLGDIRGWSTQSTNLQRKNYAREVCDTVRLETFGKILKIKVDDFDMDGYLAGDINLGKETLSEWLIKNEYAAHVDDCVQLSPTTYKNMLE